MKHNSKYSTIDLMSRASSLGNHHQKYIFSIDKHFDTLASLVDKEGLIDQIRLLRFSQHPYDAMKKITSCVDDKETVLSLLGCYYSLQFLQLNFKAVDVLKLKLSTTDTNEYNVMRSFLTKTGDDFRLLSKAYMESLLDVFQRERKIPPFVMCSVGTKVDQDDIDLGIIDLGKSNRNIVTSASAFLNKEMLKHASPLHFHISEHVGDRSYSASIKEYHDLLDDKIGSFVLLTEMINAVPILGDFNIFYKFKSEILDRYYYNEGLDNKYHEGYLRGLLGEIHDLTMRSKTEYSLHPKKDALRMIKALIFALKTSFKIEESTSFDILNVLIKRNPNQKDDFHRLYRSLTFVETFKFLYQLFIVQEEFISLEQKNIHDILEPVANAMGYEDNNYARAATQLLIHYQDHLKYAQFSSKRIVKNITKHLGSITSFSYYNIKKNKNQIKFDPTNNFATQFIESTQFFSGTRYWQDILLALDSDSSVSLNKFLEDFNNISPSLRPGIFKEYIKWGGSSPYTLISLFTLIEKRKPNSVSTTVFHHFLAYFIKSIERRLSDIGNFCKVLDYYPKKMYNFIFLLPDSLQENLITTLDIPILDQEVNNVRKKVLALCKLHFSSSYFFRRILHRVFNTYNSYLITFDSPKKFRQLTDGLLGNIENFNSNKEKIEKLNNYYDFEFMRLGINAINGTFYGVINREFTIFSDNYLQLLFEFCKRQVRKELNYTESTRDLLAVFTAGGHARSQAFDDDYDLIILLNSTDEKTIHFANKIVVKMNKQIIQRSIMPQYRFGDRFRSFVTTLLQLKNLFENPDEETFIDKSQLLGARQVVGSRNFEQTFFDQIINPYIFKKQEPFITELITEMNSRNSYHKESKKIDIKESPGGLRDLEIFLLILKTHFKIPEPISTRLFTIILNDIVEQEEIFNDIFLNYYFLKYIRDLYHLMVSNDDLLQKKYFHVILDPISRSRKEKIIDSDELYKHIISSMKLNVKHINTIITYLGYSCHT